MDYAIEFGGPVTLPVTESNKLFPVGRIYCVGRNYAEHAREMGHDPEREPPFFFMKPADAIVPNGATIPYPQITKDLHHEIEMGVAIGKGGADIAIDKALEHVFGYGVGLDMTRRDVQGEAKKMGRPWEMGKAFETLKATRFFGGRTKALNVMSKVDNINAIWAFIVLGQWARSFPVRL